MINTTVARSAVLVLVAALPSLVWALAGADFIHDDFWKARAFETRGALSGMWWLATEAPARPGASLYYLLTFHGIGDLPVAHALLLAALNAAIAVGAWRVARRIVRPETALWAALVFAVVPNRAATRLWFTIGAYLVALGLVLVATRLLLMGRHLPVAAVALGLGVATYEGVAGLAGAVLLLWLWRNRERGLAVAAALAAPTMAAAGVMLALSPKRAAAGPGPFEHAGTVFSAQLGSGFWGTNMLGTFGALALLAAITYALARQLPSFRRQGDPLPREVLLGVATLALGALPFVVVGAPLAVSGVFDRNNLVPDLGSSLVLGALLAELLRRAGRLGLVAAVPVVMWLAIANLADVRDYQHAADDGQALVQQVLRDIDPGDDLVLIGPPLGDHRGVAQFILGGNLTDALLLREGHQWARVRLPAFRSECERLARQARAEGRAVVFYDRESRELLDHLPLGRCGQ